VTSLEHLDAPNPSAVSERTIDLTVDAQQSEQLPAELDGIERRKRRRVPLRRQLLNLALILAAIVIPFMASGRGTMLIVIASLVFFIMFHEFAHFAVAKLCGMKVTEFFVGFGPRLFSFRRGETEYGIKAIPAGGYVKIIGMNSVETVAPEDESRAYRQATWPRRFAAIVAGPASHFLVAFVLLMVIFTTTGEFRGNIPTIGTVMPQSSAAANGLLPGDRILSVNGTTIDTFDEAIKRFGTATNVPITLTVQRGATTKTVVVQRTPLTYVDPDSKKSVTSNLIGIQRDPAAPQILAKYSVGTAASKSVAEMQRLTSGTVRGMVGFFRPESLGKLFKQVAGASSAKGPITTNELESRPTSVVGMVSIGSDAAKEGPSALLSLLVLINLALGAFNLLPMLPLDGGHIVIATYEAIVSRIKGKRHLVDMNRVAPFAAVFLVFVLVLGLSAMYLDIVRPVN
jgi:membrane-associated protease RseP (regulator of RpoE activity)